jgi:hypothetical protein
MFGLEKFIETMFAPFSADTTLLPSGQYSVDAQLPAPVYGYSANAKAISFA